MFCWRSMRRPRAVFLALKVLNISQAARPLSGEAAHHIVLVRHGESEWNKKNLFCGWYDADLTEKGEEEARDAGRTLRTERFTFDVAFTSLLKRAIRSLYLIQDEMDLHWIPVLRHWRLNERHYGALQGLNKAETAARFGEEQVKAWRRSYDVPPPPLEEDSCRCGGLDHRYAALDPACLPRGESLKDTVARVLPYWCDVIAPAMRSGSKVIVVAHGNSLRALVKFLDNVTEKDISEVNIPTGIPLVYQLTSTLRPLTHFYLGDQAKVKAAIEVVSNQGKAKK